MHSYACNLLVRIGLLIWRVSAPRYADGTRRPPGPSLFIPPLRTPYCTRRMPAYPR
ncbi:hypothetical protein BJV78DRAFT_1247294 [Lactifluus subvellereus]|nr:hypothetical protein BJV78DRAFT_1247294 [Lactifluus subvellereus]